MMSDLKNALEGALNSTFPMRSPVGGGWLYAGIFSFNEKIYSFVGDIGEGVVTCRCMKSADYANHWFDMKTDFNANDERVITVSNMAL